MSLIDKTRDKLLRHKERHQALDGFQFVFSGSISFIKSHDWDAIADNNSIFLSRKYLSAIENCPPGNTSQIYAVAYSDGEPVLIMACQVAEIGGERLMKIENGVGNKLAKNYRERVLVCGNLVSSGLHGVAFANDLDGETGWRLVSEIIYKIRRIEKLDGKIDFALIKDIKEEQLDASAVIERYSYRRIQTDPDMVLELEENITSFDNYLKTLTSKYRSRINKVINTIEQAGYRCERLGLDEEVDSRLHSLYLNVERQAKTRLATLSVGYFLALSKELGENFVCYGIVKNEDIIGFISVIKDRENAVAYYVGFDYKVNEELPIYFRLLHFVVEAAIDMQCKKILFGRSALEPKASLGAKPVDTYVWTRHRVPVVNYFVRSLFRNIPFDEAPNRTVFKK